MHGVPPARSVSTSNVTPVDVTHLHIFANPYLLGRLAPRMGCESIVKASPEQPEHQAVLRRLHGIGRIFADLQSPANRAFNSFTTGDHLVYAGYGQGG